VYQVINRGGQRENIFRDDADRERFLFTRGEACGKMGWQVHAYYRRSRARTIVPYSGVGVWAVRSSSGVVGGGGGAVGTNHNGSDRQETGEQKAQRIVLEEMKRLGWGETDLRQRRKRDGRV
jgi:hypothetical protein